MTCVHYFGYSPPPVCELVAPAAFSCADVSVIVPVKDNLAGIHRFLNALAEAHDHPKEVIVVDDGSIQPVNICRATSCFGIPVIVVRRPHAGPAAARNAGAALARGEWLLFADSDCIPAANFVAGYADAMCGAIAYAGGVRALGTSRVARYYDSQRILEPPTGARGRPLHIITANALVWRRAFDRAGGFDERFPDAAGEDVDLGLRLRQVGELAYAPASTVLHDFGESLGQFVRRFARYGRGNRRVALRWNVDLRPRPFKPRRRALSGWLLSTLQFASLLVGYFSTMRQP